MDRFQGRGAASNPPNRFERLRYEEDPDADRSEVPSPETRYLRDSTGSIISYNESPDLGFRASLNPYRGCLHGCCYCYARPYHEYLGFSAGLDFETKIVVKENAAELLRTELESPKWQRQTLILSGATDPYQPIERKLKITRNCLKVLVEFLNPVSIITKNHLVTRDIDLLSELAKSNAAAVCLSVTTLDTDLMSKLEPRTSIPQRRLAAIAALVQSGIPTGVMVAPVIPGLTDHEIPSILAEAAKAGASFAGHQLLRLPHAVLPLFQEWLDRHFPQRKEKVLNCIRATRGGALDDGRFGTSFTGEGKKAGEFHTFFEVARRRAGILETWPSLSTAAFRRPNNGQLTLL
ncbi:MAG: PA0069 family radical SAM protein [Verrucomicrobiia bacterium]|jgi:DNA repair photolyase